VSWREDVKKALERDEGRIPYAYQDSEGYWTIGVGHLIDKRLGGRLPEHIIDALLEYDIELAIAEARAFLWFEELSDARKAVIVNMMFNLGLRKFKGFKRMIAALERGDYEAAADEMLDSKWARQVGPRAVRLAQQMRAG